MSDERCPRCGGRLLTQYGELFCLMCSYSPPLTPEEQAQITALMTAKVQRVDGPQIRDSRCDRCGRVFARNGLSRHARYCAGAGLTLAKADMKGETA